MSHTVTVTRVPDKLSDDVEYTIGGTHDDRCETYKPCLKDWHRHPKNDDIVGDEWTYRGQRHAYIESEWMILADGYCGFDLSFEVDNPEFQMTELGTYDVTVYWDGDWWLAKLTLVEDLVSKDELMISEQIQAGNAILAQYPVFMDWLTNDPKGFIIPAGDWGYSLYFDMQAIVGWVQHEPERNAALTAPRLSLTPVAWHCEHVAGDEHVHVDGKTRTVESMRFRSVEYDIQRCPGAIPLFRGTAS